MQITQQQRVVLRKGIPTHRDRRSMKTLTFPSTKTWVDNVILLVACVAICTLAMYVGLFVGKLFIFWCYGVL